MASTRAFDLVFLQWRLADGGGRALIEELERAWGFARVVAMDSGEEEDGMEVEARQNGVLCCLVKPLDEYTVHYIAAHTAGKVEKST